MQKMLEAEIWTIMQTADGGVVLLRPKNRELAVPVFVGRAEIQSIIAGWEKMRLPRPLTHDLFISLLDSRNLTLEKAEIHKLAENTFHARIVISDSSAEAKTDNTIVLDSRPSDAIALAVRRGCPIFISSYITGQCGIPIDLLIDMRETIIGNPPNQKEETRHRLEKQLKEAVEREEYEQAAKYRDMLNEMEKENNKENNNV